MSLRVFRSPRRVWHFVVHPSTREEGRFQLTRFEGDEPTGHTTWDAEEDACASACGRRAAGQIPVGDKSFTEEEASSEVELAEREVQVESFRSAWLDYVVDVSTALMLSVGWGEITSAVIRQRVPQLGDPVAPWDVRGWLLPHAMDLLPPGSGIGRGRWWYWLRCLELGRLPEEPIPPCHFENVEDGSKTAAGKMLGRCIDLIDAREGHWRGECATHLLEWVAWALHVSDRPSRLKPGTQEALYRPGGFCLDPLLERPADYFGWMLSELKGRGTDPRGFYPTPMDVTKVMAELIFPRAASRADCRAETVSDPCVGTGRMLLAASNWSLRLFGQDIDARCVTATLVNGALYAPWLSFPLPESFWRSAVPHLQEEPLGVTVFDPVGQGLLFGSTEAVL